MKHILFPLLIIFNSCSEQEKPKSIVLNIKASSTIAKTMKDAFVAFELNETLKDHHQFLSTIDLNCVYGEKLLRSYIFDAKKISIEIQNDTLRDLARRYLKISIDQLLRAQEYGIGDTKFTDLSNKRYVVQTKFRQYLFNKYTASTFEELTIDSYWLEENKKKIRTSKSFIFFETMCKNKPSKALKMLKTKMNSQCSDEEKSLYQFGVIAHVQRVKTFWTKSEKELFEKNLIAHFKRGKYHSLLLELWLNWQAISNQNLSIVKEIRQALAQTFINENSGKEKNQEAVFQFIQLYTTA